MAKLKKELENIISYYSNCCITKSDAVEKIFELFQYKEEDDDDEYINDYTREHLYECKIIQDVLTKAGYGKISLNKICKIWEIHSENYAAGFLMIPTKEDGSPEEDEILMSVERYLANLNDL